MTPSVNNPLTMYSDKLYTKSFPNPFFSQCFLYKYPIHFDPPIVSHHRLTLAMPSYQQTLLAATFHALAFVTTSNAATDLGSAAAYRALAASDLTSTGLSIVNGDIGVYPGTSITGFPPGVFTGIESDGDPAAATAQSDAADAYQAAIALPCGTDLTGEDLGGQTLAPGVYCFSSSATLTGILTLDAGANSNAQFVFQIGSTLGTATGSQVLLVNGAQSCGVTWAVGSSATLGTGTDFVGDILAEVSITLV